MGRPKAHADTAAKDQAHGKPGTATPSRPKRAAAEDTKARLAGRLAPLPPLPPPVAAQQPGTPCKAKPAGDAARGKGKDQGRKPAAAARKRARVTSEITTPDGGRLRAGEDYYVALENFDDDLHGGDDEAEACEACGSSRPGSGMLECGECLRGFHLRCLAPPLKRVPDGEWLCPQCNAGDPAPRPSKLVTWWQRLLYGDAILGLVHVVGFTREEGPDGEECDAAIVRYYLLPEETHLGRQRHHRARELFLSKARMLEPAGSLLYRAYVRSERAFEAAQDGLNSNPNSNESVEGNDVFMCEYEYDEGWKRFSRRVYPGEGRGGGGGGGGGGGWGGFEEGSSSDEGSDSGDDGGGDAYRPEPRGGGRGGAASRRAHGALELPLADEARFDGLGADAIPEAARAPPRDALSEVHAALSLAAVPAVLPCRDAEKAALAAFVDKAIRGDGGVLYVCGVPGTGKTACMSEVLAAARARARAAGTQFVSLNCLQLPSPLHVYSQLWERLSGQRLGPARARDALQSAFGAGRRRFSTLVILDEIDMLMTRDQAVLYNLFEWPLAPGARLAVVGISNTHDLDQRVLPRIGSRLTEAKLAFQPYSVAQIGGILRGRVAGCSEPARRALHPTALELAARKVASETGDVRRALELLRRATEIVQFERHQQQQGQRGQGQQQQQQEQQQQAAPPAGGHLVMASHVTRATQELFNAMHMQLLRGTSLVGRLVLVGVVLEARATGRGLVVMQSVMQRVTADLCPLIDEPPPADGVLQHAACRLAGSRLLLADASHVKARLQLNVTKDDVAQVVRDDPRLARLHQLMG